MNSRVYLAPVRLAVPALLAAALWGGGTAAAQDAPQCTAATFGQASCMANRVCECIYERGGAITGRPTGYRWDCGINRRQCEVDPASIVEHRGNTPQYPAAVGLDRSDRSVTVGQDSVNTNSSSSTSTSN